MAHFKNLIVWQKAIDLAETIYLFTNTFPSNQQYRLVDQLQRAAVSIMSNIAEGSQRSPNEWKHFLRIAHGSAAELESQILLAQRLGYITNDQYNIFVEQFSHISRMLHSMAYKKVENKP